MHRSNHQAGVKGFANMNRPTTEPRVTAHDGPCIVTRSIVHEQDLVRGIRLTQHDLHRLTESLFPVVGGSQP